jgi:hypothetical protein
MKLKENLGLVVQRPTPNDTILSTFGSPNQTSQEVTHPEIALAEARLTAEF